MREIIEGFSKLGEWEIKVNLWGVGIWNLIGT
jgi:hypothetical protein